MEAANPSNKSIFPSRMAKPTQSNNGKIYWITAIVRKNFLSLFFFSIICYFYIITMKTPRIDKVAAKYVGCQLPFSSSTILHLGLNSGHTCKKLPFCRSIPISIPFNAIFWTILTAMDAIFTTTTTMTTSNASFFVV